MSRNALVALIRQLEILPGKEKARLRALPWLTPEERERAREALRKRVKFVAVPNPDNREGGGLDGWERDALKHLSTAEIFEYILARNRILGLAQYAPGAWRARRAQLE